MISQKRGYITRIFSDDIAQVSTLSRRFATQARELNFNPPGIDDYYEGEYAKRDLLAAALRYRTPGTDVDVCFSGCIAVTPVTVLGRN